MVEIYNEGKAIDAVIRCIEARENSWRLGDGWSPDDKQDPDKERRVDCVCTVGKQLYAFEHTGIEPFDDEIEMQEHNATLFRPVMERFDNRTSDDEYWELMHPVEAADGLSGGRIKKVQDALISWIEANATTLPVMRFGDRRPYGAENESALGVPFRFSLYRSALPRCELSGRLRRAPCVKRNLEKARLVRLERVSKKKFPKLARWKYGDGARTVLVLEENDQSLTNPQNVYEAMVRAEAGRSDAPDEIYLVSTFRPSPWWVSCLRRKDKTYYDDGERFHEADPAGLTQLTNR
ncbi:MAG: hypothetical protein ABSG18_25345 [Steroidobacteraceae bacterium]|jgi:hypothetical protein